MDSVRNDAGKLQKTLETASKLLGAAHPAVEAARKDILRLQHQEQVEHFTTHRYTHTHTQTLQISVQLHANNLRIGVSVCPSAMYAHAYLCMQR